MLSASESNLTPMSLNSPLYLEEEETFRTSRYGKSAESHLMYDQMHNEIMLSAMISVIKLQNVSKPKSAKIPLKT